MGLWASGAATLAFPLARPQNWQKRALPPLWDAGTLNHHVPSISTAPFLGQLMTVSLRPLCWRTARDDYHILGSLVRPIRLTSEPDPYFGSLVTLVSLSSLVSRLSSLVSRLSSLSLIPDWRILGTRQRNQIIVPGGAPAQGSGRDCH